MTPRTILLPLALTSVLVGYASTDPYTGSSRNQMIDVQYGTIEYIQQVKMDASYGKDSVTGEAIGLLATSQVADAVVGAGLGALVAKGTVGTGQRKP